MIGSAARLPIVFAGLSITPVEAAPYLSGEYRPPIRRGDLEQIADGAVVLILDGMFDRVLAVSPGEIRAALARGVRIFGAASMGALRAAEVPGIQGIGRIYELYASGEIVDDDEVAVLVDPRDHRPQSVPMVNIRHAVARLAATGTINRDLARRIVDEAKALPYALRNWCEILTAAAVADPAQAAQLESLLSAIDLKREDAITALELVARLDAPTCAPTAAEKCASPASDSHAPMGDGVHLWEFAPPVAFGEIVAFLACTGRLADAAERAVMLLPADSRAVDDHAASRAAERFLGHAARAWHWVTEEEVSTSMADLSLDAVALHQASVARAGMRVTAQSLVAARDPSMLAALRHWLFLDDLALKREAARLLSVRWLAANDGGATPLTAGEIATIETAQRRWLDVRDSQGVSVELEAWGVTQDEQRNFVEQIARARRTPTVRAIASCNPVHPWLASVPKVAGGRFCTSLDAALEAVERIRPQLGITRLAMIAGLGPLGIPVAQAFRPDGEWSSTVGSGKSTSEAGARIGAVMEEVEKWSQERFSIEHDRHLVRCASYREVEGQYPVADPATFDLPFDSAYDPETPIDWYEASDLLSGGPLLVPAAAFNHRRLPGDIYYSAHGARKTVTTNGLAAGMTIQEALVHAICEFVERHARTMTVVAEDNPGTLHPASRAFVELNGCPPSIQALVAKIRAAGFRIIVRDIRRDIDIPVFAATILIPDGLLPGALFGDGWQRASGWACFPDPAVALEMAILEACQTILSHIAGAREDLLIHARSLGRHERSDCCRAAGHHADLDPDAPCLPFESSSGWISNDAGSDLRWLLERLSAAGCRQVAAIDFSRPEIAPVRAVRVVIPGLETINAFHTGRRARRALVEDLLGVQ